MGDKLHFKKCIWYVYMTQNTNDTLSPKGHKDRNNSRSPRSRIFGPCTFNNYKQEDLDNLVVLLKSIAEEYYINQEIGLNMTPHLQFCFRTKNALQFNSVIKKFPGCHMEISHNWMATVLYCKKTDTAIADNINSLKVVDDPMEGHTPYDWQSRIINCLNTKPDNRTINWIYDLEGNTGKTSIAKHLCIKYPGQVLYMSGKASDIKYGVYQFVSNPKNDLKICIFDFPRTTEHYISYDAIESVKNGIFYNTKYECEMCIFNPPHIWCMANFEPDYDKLSDDRWNTIILDKEINMCGDEYNEDAPYDIYDSYEL